MFKSKRRNVHKKHVKSPKLNGTKMKIKPKPEATQTEAYTKKSIHDLKKKTVKLLTNGTNSNGIRGKPKVKGTTAYSKMSVDDFLNNFDDSDSDHEAEEKNGEDSHADSSVDSEGEVEENSKCDEEAKLSDQPQSDGSDESEETSDQDEDGESDEEGDDEREAEEQDDDEDDDSDNDPIDINSHKESLAKLQETDPEFYKFLQDNDKKLLDFNVSDSDNEGDDATEPDVHKPTGDLEGASDESDFEADEDEVKESDRRVVTLKMLKGWQNEIRTDKTNKTISCLMRAFHAAVVRVSNEQQQEPAHYKVDGSSVFNGVIQLCVLELGPAVRKFLGLGSGVKQAPHKCKRFVKIKSLLRGYFDDLLKILSGVTSSNILNVLLKHLHYMSPMIVSFGNVTKPLLKKLIKLWGTSDESVRVISFLCILRITNNQRQNLLDTTLKAMYLTYVNNSKFVSTNTLPAINFMRRSLVEMFALDVNVAYKHVFLYVRQLAIHLRNAITVNKKENTQAVLNWQFINSLKLWGNLLTATCDKQQLQPLIYPFVQVCIGTIKLIPTATYYPLRFHILQILMDLSKDTDVFIPVLPFLLEIFTTYDFNKKHQKVSMKPLHFTCVLRLSKSQMLENGFKDTVIETLYAQLLEYLSSKSHSIAFPDLSLFCVVNLKQFIKKCSIASYTRKMRQLLEKIEQNNKFIIDQRKNVSFELKDFKRIEAWDTTIKNNGTPLSTYYESWNKMRNVKKSKQATNNEAIGDYNLPVLKKMKKTENKDGNKRVELFPSDSESDAEKEVAQTTEGKRRRGTRGGKNVKKKQKFVAVDLQDDGVGVQDIVEDLKVDDW